MLDKSYCFACKYFADPKLERDLPLGGKCIKNPPQQVGRTELAMFPLVTALMRCAQFEKRPKDHPPIHVLPFTDSNAMEVDPDDLVAILSALRAAVAKGDVGHILKAYYGRINDE